MKVTRQELERGIELVRERVSDPAGGVYGRGSIGWEISRENVLFLGGGCAALLQLAHPYVAYAVDEHSETRRDPIGRFQRTFFHVYGIAFGDLERAIESARRVHDIHARIHGRIGEAVGPFAEGDRYDALDADALGWVHATLIHTAVQVFDRVVRPLRPDEKEAYYQRSRLFGLLFGVPYDLLPATWPGFVEYCEGMFESSVLTVSRPAQEIARFLLYPEKGPPPGVFRWYRMMTADLLPPRIRQQYGLTLSRRERWIVQRSYRSLHRVLRPMPGRVRFVPDFHEAEGRLRGDEQPDRFGRALSRIALARLMPRRKAGSVPRSAA